MRATRRSRLLFLMLQETPPEPAVRHHPDAVEIKTCELCGKLFTRQVGSGVKDCAACILNPPTEDEDQGIPIRSYRLHGVRLKG